MEGKVQADSVVIVGVLPPGFRYDNRDLWLPLNRFWGNIDADRGNHWFSGIGRLKADSLERARADLDAVSRDLEQQFPATNKAVRVIAVPMIDYYAGSSRTPLLLLMGAVGFVMLIACTNVVLPVALRERIGRSREIAVRLALGVDRLRLLRLLMSESLIVAVIGGVAGVLLSMWAVALGDRLPTAFVTAS